MHVRIRFAGQETWYRKVLRAVQDGRGYLCLTHDGYPYQTFHWRFDGRLSVLIADTDADVIEALREENPDGAWSWRGTYTTPARATMSSWDAEVENWWGR